VIGYGPAAEAIRAERGLPYATGADDPPGWHDHPGMTGPDDRAPGRPRPRSPRRAAGNEAGSMTTTTDTCWADPLSRMERKELRLKLARSCKRSYDAARFVVARDPQPADIEMMRALTIISAEMSDLHLDVTERAEVAA
jgi:hypothetical protein